MEKCSDSGRELRESLLVDRCRSFRLRLGGCGVAGSVVKKAAVFERFLADFSPVFPLSLASLYRHTERKSKAGEHLRWLERLTASRPWAHEIETEWRLLNEMGDSGVIAPGTESTIDNPHTTTQNDFESNNKQHSQTPAAA